MRKIILILICITYQLSSQSIDNSVINAAGQTQTINPNFIYTDNIGEPFVSTEIVGTYTFTQGFLQIFDVPKVLVIYNHLSCSERKDGNISVSVSNIAPTQTVTYYWTPSSICPTNACNKVDSLNAGTYSLTISIKTPTGGLGFVEQLYAQNPITIEDKFGPCKVKIYNTITANGDGINDFLTIDNLEEFPDHEITIYNRWGKQLKSIKNYKNDNGWPTKNETVISGTYFYVLDLGKGVKPIKGWVEVLNN